MPGDRDVAYALEQEDAAKMLPKRREDSHKGTYGKVLIIAGSKGMAGAAYLAHWRPIRRGQVWYRSIRQRITGLYCRRFFRRQSFAVMISLTNGNFCSC